MVETTTAFQPTQIAGATQVAPAVRTRTERTADQRDYSPTTYSNYLFGKAGQNTQPLWSDSVKGRIAIRLLSRGVFGAVAFAWGSRYSGKALQRYEPETFNITWESLRAEPLKAVAKGIDNTVGRAIEKTAAFMAPKGQEKLWAYESTRFRSKSYYHGSEPVHGIGGVGLATGRSLGAEIVDVTFNFAMASIADASVRNAIQGLDPHNKKSWLLDKDGKPTSTWRGSHFVFHEWARSTASAVWRVLSKNQGEDWAAALPYVYQMKWQRQWIASHSPNFKLSADNHLHGATYLVDKEGNVHGDLMKAGAVDLHTRFVGYNWYTLMYRETYDMIGYKFNQWRQNHFKLEIPSVENPVRATVDGIGSVGRYVLKSFIKSNIYMQPAVLFFWPTRVAQSRVKGGAIAVDPGLRENAFITTQSMNADLSTLAQRNGVTGNPRDTMVPLMDRAYHKHGPEYEYRYQTRGKIAVVGKGGPLWSGNTLLPANSEIARAASPFDPELQKSAFSKVLNPIGQFCHSSGNVMTRFADWARPLSGQQHAERAQFIHDTVNASLAYTPYMIAKAEFAYHVDERPSGHELGEMDKSIYRFIDNIFTFNPKAAVKSVGDIVYHAVRTKEHISGREGGAPETATPAPQVQKETLTRTALQPAADPVAKNNQRIDPKTAPWPANTNVPVPAKPAPVANENPGEAAPRAWSSTVQQPSIAVGQRH